MNELKCIANDQRNFTGDNFINLSEIKRSIHVVCKKKTLTYKKEQNMYCIYIYLNNFNLHNKKSLFHEN
jgi:hypothetical protein